MSKKSNQIVQGIRQEYAMPRIPIRSWKRVRNGRRNQVLRSRFSCLQVSNEDSVIMCAGKESKAKAKAGSWITLSEWKWNDKKNRYVPVCVKTEYVDGNNIKADTWYQLQNGEFVEVTK